MILKIWSMVCSGVTFLQRFELQTSAKTFFPTWLDEGDVFSFDNSMLQVEQS